MTDEADSFVMVLDPDEVRRHVPQWPDDVLLGAALRDGSPPDVRRLAIDGISAFARSLPVVPLRPGFACATPAADAEATLFATAIGRAASILAEPVEDPAPAGLDEDDQFSDIAGTTASAPVPPSARFLIRRLGQGFELRTLGLEQFPWDMDRICLGASYFGASFVEQPLDRMLTFAVTVADLGPMAPMASFLPRKWTEVPVVEGPAGPYFDVSPVLLGEVARRVRLATLLSAGAIALTGFLIAAAVGAAVWNTLVRAAI